MHTYLEAVFPHVEDSESVVGAEYGAEMLAVLWSQMVGSQPQLRQVLIELHGRHWGGGGGGGGGG